MINSNINENQSLNKMINKVHSTSQYMFILYYSRSFIGPQTYDHSIAHITKRFNELNTNPRKTVFVHQTCATDTDQVQLILDSVISMIIQANLHKSGLY